MTRVVGRFSLFIREICQFTYLDLVVFVLDLFQLVLEPELDGPLTDLQVL